jgi:hypothetical protein
MITIASLQENGYRYFDHAFKRSPNLSAAQDPYKGLYQKCIRDTKGKKYFINFHCWDFANSFVGYQNVDREMGFEGDIQLTLPNGDSVNIEYLGAGKRTVVEIETWFESVWQSLGAQYYEEYEVA